MNQDHRLTDVWRTKSGRILLLIASLIPVTIDYLSLHIRLIRRLLHLPLYCILFCSAFWVGRRWFEVIHTRTGYAPNSETGYPEEKPDWFAFTMALIVGFGVMGFLIALMANEMLGPVALSTDND